MKKIYLLLFCIVTSISFGQDLVLTGLVDGPLTGGIPKAVELYVLNDIPDLSIYGLGSANNGGGTDGEEFTFPAEAATAGSYLYIASEAVEFANFFGFSPNYTSSAASINGDDAVELFQNGVVIDVFGDINVDGTGEAWDYLDGWAYRNTGTGPDSSTFVIGNWTFSGTNALDGETTNATAAIPFPIGTFGGGTVVTVANPTGFTADAVSISQIDLSWNLNANADDVIIAYSQDTDVAGTPEDGTSYTVGDALTGGGEIIFAGNATTLSHTGLLENTAYHYKIWSVDGSTTYSSGVAANAQTLSSEPPAASDLVITGVVDGPLSGGIPKAIELYALNDIPDLSIYGIGSANNGGGTDGEEFSLPADAAAKGDFIYIASESTGFTEFFGFAPNYTSGAASINGDDAIELFLNGNVVDVFGDINVDGSGQAWDYLDGWAYRIDKTGPDGTAFELTNWNFSGTNVLDGELTNDSASTPFPIGTYNSPALLITGVLDGPLSGGVPKAVELYALKDIADLSSYGIGSANNGGGTDGEEFTFPAVAIAKGEFLYIASETAGFTTFFGFAPTYTSGAANVNGDDAIELFENGAVIDVFGDINVDGTGQSWEYLDGWAYRINGTKADGDVFNLSNWTFSGRNALDNETTNASAASPFPIGTYQTTGDPVLPDPITILEARNKPEGQVITISGVLTVSDQFAGAAYIQDATAGIAIFDESVHGDGVFQVGDSITVTGTRSVFNNLIQISPVTNVAYNGLPNVPIEPKTITLSELPNHPSELVRILDVSFESPGNLLFGNSNYAITDASGTGEIRIDGDVESIVGLAQPELCGELIGVVGQFFEIYQLMPRFHPDMTCAAPYEPTGDDLAISKDRTFDLVTWNIEWFGDEGNSPAAGDPDSDAIQKDSVKTVIQALNADIYAVEEIADDALFAQLVSELSGYDYVLSEATSYPDDPGAKQKIGFIYNTTTVEVLSTKVLLESIHPYYNGGDDSALIDYPVADRTRFYASGRLPFMLTANVTIDGNTQEVSIIDIHARANSSSDAQERYDMRKYDVEVLKDSLDAYYPNANIILLGDYNDDVDETVADISSTISSYEAYTADSGNYNVVTSTLSDQGFRSYVFRENMIDHIMVSDELFEEYIVGSSRVHYEFYDSDYTLNSSDHFPVSTRLQIKVLTLDSSSYTDVTCNGAADGTASVTISGGIAPYTYEWTNSTSTSATATGLSPGTYMVTVTDFLGAVVNQEFIITEPDVLSVSTTEDTTVYFGYPPESCTTLSVLEVTGGTAPYAYEWSTGDTTASITVCPELTTEYVATITDANGCIMEAIIHVEVVDVRCGTNQNNPKVEICHNGKTICVAQAAVQSHLDHGDSLGSCNETEGAIESMVQLYPNPFNAVLNAKFNLTKNTSVALLVYDFNGTIVARYSNTFNPGATDTPINLEHLNPGVYYVEITIDGNDKSIQRLIKL